MDIKEVTQLLRDYHWMINTIREERKELEPHTVGVAQYGVESTLPKPQGKTSDVVSGEVIRREKKSVWIMELESKVKYIQDRIYIITDERQKAVLHYLLDGKSNRWISFHMGLSHTHINRIIDEITLQLL